MSLVDGVLLIPAVEALLILFVTALGSGLSGAAVALWVWRSTTRTTRPAHRPAARGRWLALDANATPHRWTGADR